MNKDEINFYINTLKELEKSFLDDDDDDDSIIGDLDGVLSKLSNDIQESYGPQNLKLPIKIKKLKQTAVIPTYSVDGDAGMDLTVTEIVSNTTFDVTYGFGIAMEIPKGYVGLIFPRSSVKKYDLFLSNAVGVIDSGYRGEIMSTFKKTNGLDSFSYKVGERAAQILILPYPQIEFIETDDLSKTERNEGGFGHTGL